MAVETQCKVTEYLQLTPTVFQLSFVPEIHFEFKPGQFLSVVIPGAAGGRDLRRAYSIASHPENHQLQLCVKLVENGPGTNYLNKLRPGDHLKIGAPYGTFIYKSKPEKDVIFISTGTGISPFRSMVFSKLYNECKPRTTTLLLGVREEYEILYDSIFSKVKDLKWHKTVSRPQKSEGWSGTQGRVTDYFKDPKSNIQWSETDFYLCGNGAMIDEMKKILTDNGVTKEAIHQEVYYKPKPGEEG